MGERYHDGRGEARYNRAMALKDALARFREQFDYQPVIENRDLLRRYKHTIVCGMGGSHLAPWFLQVYGNRTDIIIHRDYGLPNLSSEVYQDALVILSSHSGGTEEVLDSGREALARGLPIAASSTGGKLIEFARKHSIPHVVFPHMDLQPRVAAPLSLLAVTALLQDTALEAEIRAAGLAIDSHAHASEGARIGALLTQKVPLIYASAANAPLAYIWKIKINETGKVPAFQNVFPEMNHNELCGFDVVESTRAISAQMHAIFLEDSADHPRNQKRMQAAAEILVSKGIPVERVQLSGEGFTKLFNTANMADWVALTLAGNYGVPDEAVPLIEDFKKRIA